MIEDEFDMEFNKLLKISTTKNELDIKKKIILLDKPVELNTEKENEKIQEPEKEIKEEQEKKVKKTGQIKRGILKKKENEKIIEKDNSLIYYFIRVKPRLEVNINGLLEFLQDETKNYKESKEYMLDTNEELKGRINQILEDLKTNIKRYLSETEIKELLEIEENINKYQTSPRKTQKIKSLYVNAINKLKILSNKSGCNLFKIYKIHSDLSTSENLCNEWKELEINFNEKVKSLNCLKQELQDIEKQKRSLLQSADLYYTSILTSDTIYRQGNFKGIAFSKLSRDQVIDRIKEYKISKIIEQGIKLQENLNLHKLKKDIQMYLNNIETEEFSDNINKKGIKWSIKTGLIKNLNEEDEKNGIWWKVSYKKEILNV